jgi:hypothetical protein
MIKVVSKIVAAMMIAVAVTATVVPMTRSLLPMKVKRQHHKYQMFPVPRRRR